MDRFDLRIEVPPVAYSDLDLPESGDCSAKIRDRVAHARHIQEKRFANTPGVRVNADAEGSQLEEIAAPDPEGKAFLSRVAQRMGLSARGYHRVLRVARTIADLECSSNVRYHHVAEAVGYRLTERMNAIPN